MLKKNYIKGVNLTEILIAISILGIAIGPLISLFTFSAKSSRNEAQYVQAYFIAHKVLEDILAMNRVKDNYNSEIGFTKNVVKLHKGSYFDSPSIFFKNIEKRESYIKKNSKYYKQFKDFTIDINKLSIFQGLKRIEVTVKWKSKTKKYKKVNLIGYIETSKKTLVRRKRL